MATCRLILCCNSTSRVIPAVRSRCLSFRVAAPTIDQIGQIIKQTCKSEGLTISAELAAKIATKSGRNLRRALLMLETAYAAHYPFTNDQEISEPDWELFLRETARLIVQQQSAERIMVIRDRLYELLCHCIPADVIFKVVFTFEQRWNFSIKLKFSLVLGFVERVDYGLRWSTQAGHCFDGGWSGASNESRR